MKYRLILSAIVIALLGLVSAFTYAQTLPAPTVTPAASSVIQQDIFVRGGPGRDYLPVGKLLAGDRVRPLSRNAQGDWVLIIYGKSFGWIRRDLAFWVENIDALPIMDVANLTPSPVLPTTPTGTPRLLPTDTPAGNWVQLDGDAQSGFVRAGPGRTYLRLGQLLTGDAVEPVSRNGDGSWIMIRNGDGFGWVARNLVHWVNNIDQLPVVAVDNLTPSATFTATNTATPSPTSTYTLTPSTTPTFTATATVTPTLTPSHTPTLEPSATDTIAPTNTLTSTPTETLIPTLVPTVEPSATDTMAPTSTSASTATETLIPTIAPSATELPSATPTQTTAPIPTDVPTYTLTFIPTVTVSYTPTAVVQAVIAPSFTATIVPSLTSTITSTVTPIPPTNTAVPSATFTATVTSSATSTTTSTPVPPTLTVTPSATLTVTATVVSATVLPPAATHTLGITQQLSATTVSATMTLPERTQDVTSTVTLPSEKTAEAVSGLAALTPTPNNPENPASPASGPAPEVVIAGLILAAILAYAFIYWRGTTGSERYASGFVIDICPVCHRSHLIVEARQERLFGIPRARHSVRCTECRSVLREVGNERWRYAVDPMANPELYQRFNGQILDEQTLITLAQYDVQTSNQRGMSSTTTPPDFVDDDT